MEKNLNNLLASMLWINNNIISLQQSGTEFVTAKLPLLPLPATHLLQPQALLAATYLAVHQGRSHVRDWSHPFLGQGSTVILSPSNPTVSNRGLAHTVGGVVWFFGDVDQWFELFYFLLVLQMQTSVLLQLVLLLLEERTLLLGLIQQFVVVLLES